MRPPKAACDEHSMVPEERWLLRAREAFEKSLQEARACGAEPLCRVAGLELGCRCRRICALSPIAEPMYASTRGLRGDHLPGLGSPWQGGERGPVSSGLFPWASPFVFVGAQRAIAQGQRAILCSPQAKSKSSR